MKALISLILALFIVCNVKAQGCTTYTFVNPDNILKYTTYDGVGDDGVVKITFSKDSFLINQKFYRKLIVLDYEINKLTGKYYFREENGKVYLFEDEAETLLYDFCLNAGENFDSHWKVVSKNKISTDGNATTRYQYGLISNDNEFQKWIEGIGGFTLVLSSLTLSLCEYYSKDQSQIYYEALSPCTSPVKTSHVSHENIWHLTVPDWINPGYDYWLSFTKDSFLLDQRYYRKQISKKSNSDEWEESDYYFREYLGRVYTKYKDNKEVLSYNYAAEVGDTLYSIQSPDDNFIVSEIENIITLDGVTRRKLTIKNDCGADGTEITWIEGIGETQTLDGLERGCIVYDPVPQFNCILINNQIVYTNGFCISSIEPTDYQVNITLLPNPTSDHIQIKGDVQTIKSIQITDVTGRLMLEKVIQNDTYIHVASLASGIYICKIQWINGKSQSLKFVKY